MSPRQLCLACLERDPPAWFEAALWIAAEHDPALQPAAVLRELGALQHKLGGGLPNLPVAELAQPLLRRLGELDYHEDLDSPPGPRAALLHQVLRRRRGQPPIRPFRNRAWRFRTASSSSCPRRCSRRSCRGAGAISDLRFPVPVRLGKLGETWVDDKEVKVKIDLCILLGNSISDSAS